MDARLAVAFWGVSFLAVMTPGADWAYAISSGLRRRDSVGPAVSGMLAGHLTATLLVAAGIAAVFAASEAAMTALTSAGAVYLIWLGISALRRPATPDLTPQCAPAGAGRLFAKGIGISLLNPKVILLFLALLPQFTSATAAWPTGAQILGLGVLHLANCALVYFAVGYGTATVLTRRPRAAQVVGVLSGVVMIALGAALIAEKLITLAG